MRRHSTAGTARALRRRDGRARAARPDRRRPHVLRPRQPTADRPDRRRRARLASSIDARRPPTATAPAAFRARAASRRGAGIVILPDVRGLHPVLRGAGPAVRGARHRRRGHRLVRADGGRRAARATDFEYMPHVEPDDVGGHRRRHRGGRGGAPGGDGDRRRRARSRSGSAWAAGCRSSPATLGLDLAGVIGLYGTLAGPWRNDAPAPVDRVDDDRVAGARACSAAPTRRSRRRRSRRSTRPRRRPASTHRIVTYPGAPHSFFDRKAADFADGERGGLGRGPGVRRPRGSARGAG